MYRPESLIIDNEEPEAVKFDERELKLICVQFIS